MGLFSKKKQTSFYTDEDFLLILDKIQELNNAPTPKINNWKLRQQWINNYIDITKDAIILAQK